MVADPSNIDLSGLGIISSPAASHQLLLIVLVVNQQVPHQHGLTPVSWREQRLRLLSASVLGYKLYAPQLGERFQLEKAKLNVMTKVPAKIEEKSWHCFWRLDY